MKAAGSNDGVKTIVRNRLTHVSDSALGITRKRKGKSFVYFLGSKQLRDKETLERIRSLVIPPAWERVWICTKPNGHLQATGYDTKGRKQYLYHPGWTEMRSATKFDRLIEFGRTLESIRKQVKKDLALPGLPLKKVLATIVSLMEYTGARPGSREYEKQYGSHGLTTLKDKHVSFAKDSVSFTFIGKKGVKQNISVRNKQLARIVRQCKEIPGQELFQFIDENGKRHAVDSGMLNNYLHEISGKEFTAKDFRTWAGTLHALSVFQEMEDCSTKTKVQKNIIAVLDNVASYLGNTRSVCKKYYVHPVVVDLYEKGKLTAYISADRSSSQEKLLLNILKKIK
jgi:DNA topoisomerase-1